MIVTSRTLPPRRSLGRIYALEAKYEMLKLLRLPAFVLPTLGFPLLFYCFFGIAFGGARPAGPVTMGTYLLATYGTFGVVGAALFGFGVGVATERGQGWMLLKRATPMPPLAAFAAKTAAALVSCLIIVLGLFTLAAGAAGVRLAAASWLELAAILVGGAVPFCAFGLALGFLCGPNSAPAVVNLVYLPMAFASGLWVPVHMLPGLLRQAAPWLPPYHLSQLALGVVGGASGPRPLVSVIYLAGFTAVALLVAVRAYRRDQGRTYG